MTFVFTGPESTGKTTLANHFAQSFNAPLVKEYAREYLEQLNRAYTFDDVVKMAENQLKLEQAAIGQKAACLFLDTDLITYKIWLKEKFNKSLLWIDEAIINSSKKHYFLCDIDVPWQHDPLREHPNPKDRRKLYEMYLNLLLEHQLSFTIVSGNFNQRIKFCEEIIKVKHNSIKSN